MLPLLIAIALAPLVVALYAYVGYPILLRFAAGSPKRAIDVEPPAEWPTVTVTVPVHNAAPSIAATIESILAIEYPRDRMQYLAISDASTDGTDDVVQQFAARGVELLRIPDRRGKTWAENVAVASARGEIIVNIDATVTVPPASLKPLIRAFDDPSVGVASGRDVSAGDALPDGRGGESKYVGYEMWIRDLETRVGSIVGASGCFYAIRRAVHAAPLPAEYSWDFASALTARELGFRSVSVPDAVCLVPPTRAIATERTRKVRTMARGLSTLYYKRALMNPFRYGGFAFMLMSHKLLRWLPYLLMPAALLAVIALAVTEPLARPILAVVAVGWLLGVIGSRVRGTGRAARLLRFAGFVTAILTAGFLAWVEAFRRTKMATWDPTPRAAVQLAKL